MTIRRVGIVAKEGLTAAAPHLAAVVTWLRERGLEAIVETETARLADLRDEPALSRDAIVHQVDLLLVLGGDGTLLGMAGRVGAAELDTPILGVNFGRLGFLTEVTLEELYGTLDNVLAGRAEVHLRQLLRAVTFSDGAPRAEHVVLNDVVLSRGELSRVVELSVAVNGGFVTRVKADGIIISSPTGSTAYNLAASGPIVHPEVDAILITPIAPHTLAQRPLVVPGSNTVEVSALNVDIHPTVYATFDGQAGYAMAENDVVRISRAARPVRLISSTTRSYYDTLREKLGWGGR